MKMIKQHPLMMHVTFLAILSFLLLPNSAEAASSNVGAELSLFWGLPFAGILLSIALGPLVAAKFWHHHYGKISFAWALLFLIPFLFVYGLGEASAQLAHTLLLEYIPFVILLLSLFVVSGGIVIKSSLVGTPVVNTSFLAFGAVLASLIGTTGASMVLIRPMIRANAGRTSMTHIVIFFIFIVSNAGGSLTPLGDPPLFLGFLKGVDFFWTTTHLAGKTAIVVGGLLIMFYFLDRWFVTHQDKHSSPKYDEHTDFQDHTDTLDHATEKLQIKGGINIVLLMCIVTAVLMSGLVKSDTHFDILGSHVELQNVIRDGALLVICVASIILTPKTYRHDNGFDWEPIVEVAKIFAGIFVTIIPVIAILRAETDGALASLISVVSTPEGNPVNWAYFWMTGILSSFLDNAPTYLVFFNVAGGDAVELMTTKAVTLAAISSSAVFMGAMTYIGNAPNFMVRSIAINRGIKMPSFFGYMAWSIVFITPMLILINFIYFV